VAVERWGGDCARGDGTVAVAAAAAAPGWVAGVGVGRGWAATVAVAVVVASSSSGWWRTVAIVSTTATAALVAVSIAWIGLALIIFWPHADCAAGGSWRERGTLLLLFATSSSIQFVTVFVCG
jgi:hypothetical protein